MGSLFSTNRNTSGLIEKEVDKLLLRTNDITNKTRSDVKKDNDIFYIHIYGS